MTTTTNNNSDSTPKLNSSSTSEVKLVRVAVGSTNPCKIRAVQLALHKVCQVAHDVKWDVQGFPVPSGVRDQPWGDKETRDGAKNRAKAAFWRYSKDNHGVHPHLAVGLEGGLEWVEEDFPDENNDNEKCDESDKSIYCMAWMAIYGRRQAPTVEVFASQQAQTYFGDKKPIFGTSKTGSFAMPPPIAKLVVEKGLELGDADDQVFGRTNSKHGSGTVGVLTDGLIDRCSYYEHALILALTSWIRPDVYHNHR